MAVLVIADHDNATVRDTTLKTIAAAQKLSGDIDVLVLGENAQGAADQAAKTAGVRKVLLAESPALGHLVAEAVEAVVTPLMANYDALLTPATSAGKNLSPRIAAKLDVMQISDVIDVVDANTFVRPIYAGNALETVQSSDAKKVITVRPTAFKAVAAEGGSAQVERIGQPADAPHTRFQREEIAQLERPELGAAKIVVSGGRALGSAEEFHKVLEPLADKLGAAVGASRAAVDAGYAPNDYQVGQTGKVVAPDLYIAVGISGAIQHLAGMKDSKVIVAINKDPDAPIFQVADYGLVADYKTAVPQLMEELSKASGGQGLMHLARFPRRRYTPHATPLEKLEHLSRHLGGPDIWIKRDDLTGLTAGGNKTRKLEFLVADALEKGADTLITVGAVQSNHCRLTLAAAVKEGLKCRLVLEQRVPGSYDPNASGNNFLFDLLGVEAVTVVEGGADLNAAMQAIADELKGQGRHGYIIPGGGSNPLGALGYVACAEEILAQSFDLGLRLDHIVCASGSAGTHAGLLVGLLGSNAQIPLTGINVRRPQTEQEANVHALADATAKMLKLPSVPHRAVRALGDWVGPGYSLPTEEMVEAVRLLARLEGVLLDPVYTGKAMAGLLGLVARGEFGRGDNVLFLHTGGAPALYAYQPVLQQQ